MRASDFSFPGSKSFSAFRSIVSESGLSRARQERILDLIVRFLTCYTEGSLGDNLASIKDDPACADMIDVLWDHNYGPWMQSVLDDPPLPATHLELELSILR